MDLISCFLSVLLHHNSVPVSVSGRRQGEKILAACIWYSLYLSFEGDDQGQTLLCYTFREALLSALRYREAKCSRVLFINDGLKWSFPYGWWFCTLPRWIICYSVEIRSQTTHSRLLYASNVMFKSSANESKWQTNPLNSSFCGGWGCKWTTGGLMSFWRLFRQQHITLQQADSEFGLQHCRVSVGIPPLLQRALIRHKM